MTPAAVYLAYSSWLHVHHAIHGPLSINELQLMQELVTFLADVAREEDPCGCGEASILSEALKDQEAAA